HSLTSLSTKTPFVVSNRRCDTGGAGRRHSGFAGSSNSALRAALGTGGVAEVPRGLIHAARISSAITNRFTDRSRRTYLGAAGRNGCRAGIESFLSGLD